MKRGCLLHQYNLNEFISSTITYLLTQTEWHVSVAGIMTFKGHTRPLAVTLFDIAIIVC